MGICVQNSLLILEAEFPSSGDSGDLNDGRSKAVFTRFSDQVGTRTGIRVLFVRRGAGVSPGHKGWEWLFGVFDPNKFPDPAWLRLFVLHQFDLAQSGVSVIVRL
jgi:hypothetical protein